MSAFSYQQHHSIVLDQNDFFSNPNTTVDFPQFHQLNDQAFYNNHHDQISPSSMSMVVDDHKLENGSELVANKRKDTQMSSINHVQSKDTNNKMKKPKKSNDYRDEKKKTNTKNCQSEKGGALGYIHVRARRGQATDSHSLAERVRREKISERMKVLQAIVPGCDKITGKAVMLDEIVNYVQSLQNQVEFLSMKLASANPLPMLHDFGVDMDTFVVEPDDDQNMSSMVHVHPIMPSVQQRSPQGGAATFTPATDHYHHLLPQLIDGSSTSSMMFQQSHLPYNIISQGNGQQFWDVDEQRLKLDNYFNHSE